MLRTSGLVWFWGLHTPHPHPTPPKQSGCMLVLGLHACIVDSEGPLFFFFIFVWDTTLKSIPDLKCLVWILERTPYLFVLCYPHHFLYILMSAANPWLMAECNGVGLTYWLLGHNNQPGTKLSHLAAIVILQLNISISASTRGSSLFFQFSTFFILFITVHIIHLYKHFIQIHFLPSNIHPQTKKKIKIVSCPPLTVTLSPNP